MATIDLEFGKKLKKYGAIDFNACFNCGTCTAVCALSNEQDSFPRDMVRFSVLGQSNEIKNSLKPWLCYYCGECTTSCPQEAKPGELMMSLRRYLTSIYDWTGLSGLFYRNMAAYITSFLIIAATIIGLFYILNTDKTEWMHWGHLFEMFAIIGVFTIILLPNIARMWYFTVWNHSHKFDFKAHLHSLKELFIHMFTQKRTLSCEDSTLNKIWWFEHLVLVMGYLLLLFTTVFLNWFSTENRLIIYMGYVFSAAIFIITFLFILQRIGKRSEKSTFSHPSDWFFVIWLFLMGFTAFAVRLLIDMQLLETNFWLFNLHIIILAQWALVIVPFGKWTHFLYRSFAMYFAKIRSHESA
jgi:quinone-modifying oxidoreductase subunit QmoC